MPENRFLVLWKVLTPVNITMNTYIVLCLFCYEFMLIKIYL